MQLFLIDFTENRNVFSMCLFFFHFRTVILITHETVLLISMNSFLKLFLCVVLQFRTRIIITRATL